MRGGCQKRVGMGLLFGAEESRALIGGSDQQCNEAEGENGVVQGGAEEFPERRLRTGIV